MKDLEAGPGEATEDLASRKRHPSGQMTGVAPGDGPFRNHVAKIVQELADSRFSVQDFNEAPPKAGELNIDAQGVKEGPKVRMLFALAG